MSNTITATQAAEILGMSEGRYARLTLVDRWGVQPVGRNLGRGGEYLFDEDEVREALANRPRRTQPERRRGAKREDG